MLDSRRMANALTGKVAIITGGGGAIGSHVARFLAAEGASVVVNDPGKNLDGTGSSSSPADATVETIKSSGGHAVASYDSVVDFAAGERLVQQAMDSFGSLDIVVTAHGILRDRMIFNMSEQEWDDVLEVHLTGTFNLVRHACTYMRSRRAGRIITFSSTSGLVGNPGQANYGAAKSGIGGLTKVVARDMGRYGVTCNCIVPVASSRMTQSVTEEARGRRAKLGISRSALGSQAVTNDPKDIAPFIAYLASDFAGEVNGQFFYVHGNTISVMSQPRLDRSIIREEGIFSVEELQTLIPAELLVGLVNPAPRKDRND